MISDNSDSDNDTVTINETAANGTVDGQATNDDIADGLITGVENIDVNLENFSEQQVGAANMTGGTLTLNQVQTGGATSATVARVASDLDIVAGDGITGTLSVDLDGPDDGNGNDPDVSGVSIDGTNAGTVSVGDADSDGVSITANDGDTVNVEGTTNTDDAASISGAGDVTVDNDAGPGTNGTDAVENVTLSGDGSAVTFSHADTSAIATTNLSGDQDVTLSTDDQVVDGNTVNDNTGSGASTVLELTAVGGSDLSGVSVDTIDFTVAPGGNEYKVASGQSFVLNADNDSNNTKFATTTAADTGSDTINVELGVSDSNSAGDAAGTLTFDGTGGEVIETVNLTVSADATVTDLVGTADTTVDVGGSNDVTFGDPSGFAQGITADSLDAADLSGDLTVAFDQTNIDTLTGGEGNDTFATNNVAGDFTVTGNKGNDTLNLKGSPSGNTVTFNGGEGTDTLEVNNDVGEADRFDLTNVEIVDLNNNANGSGIDSRDLDGADFVLRSTGGTNAAHTVHLGDATSVDLSSLTVNDSEVELTLDASSTGTGTGNNTLSNTLTGSNAGDIITGGDVDDVLSGEGGSDTITGGTGADEISGGAGDDTIDGSEGNDTINAGTGSDQINIADSVVTGNFGADTVDLGDDGDGSVTTGASSSVQGGVIVGEFDAQTDDPGSGADEVDINFSNGDLNAGTGDAFTTDTSGAVKISNYNVGEDDIDLQNIGGGATDSEVAIGTGGTMLDDTGSDVSGQDGFEFVNVNLGNSGSSTLSSADDLLNETAILNELEQANGETSLDDSVLVDGSKTLSNSTASAMDNDEFGFLIHGPDGSAAAYRITDQNIDQSLDTNDTIDLVGLASDGNVTDEFTALS